MSLLSLRVAPLALALLQAAAPPAPQPPPAKASEIATPKDAKERLETAARVNGLAGLNKPWHLKAHFVVFGPDGKQTDAGTYEEWRASRRQYHVALHSQQVSVEQYGTEHGTFRTGQPSWPLEPLSDIQRMIEQPVSPLESTEGRELKNYERNFGATPEPCTALMVRGSSISKEDSVAYCFSQSGTALIYSSNTYRYFQTVRQDVVTVNGQMLARDMQVVLAGKRWMTVQVDTIEGMHAPDNEALTVPQDAVQAFVRTSNGEGPKALKEVTPIYPDDARRKGIEGLVIIDGRIGTDGFLKDARAIAGPPELQQAAIDAVQRWLFSPGEVDGHPVEDETILQVQFHLTR